MMRCSKKAFAMCPTRHLCCALDDATFTEESECAEFNRAVEDKPMTNADRIRSMTDEELATFISEITDNCETNTECKQHCYGCEIAYCEYKRCLEWLKQTAEGE